MPLTCSKPGCRHKSIDAQSGRRDAAGKVLPGNPQRAIAGRPVGQDDGVVEVAQALHGHVDDHFHIAEEADTRLVEDLVEFSRWFRIDVIVVALPLAA